MAVGARDDEAVEPAALQFGAQRGQPGRAGVAFVCVLERLEAGFEHRGNLWGASVRHNRAGNKVALKTRFRFVYVQCNIVAPAALPIHQAR